MKIHPLVAIALVMVGLAGPRLLWAAPPEPAEPTPEAPAAEAAEAPAAEAAEALSSEQLKQWVKQLDGNTFVEREAAEANLLQAGRAGIETLAEAAQSKSIEVHTRALRILKQLLVSSDPATKAAAKAALEKLATADDAQVARRAASALAPPVDRQARAIAPVLPGRVQIVPGLQGRIQIQGGQIQVNGGGAGGNIRVVQAQNINGVRKINASEGNTKVQIDEDPKNGITVKLTEKENNQEKVTEYQGKDLDDLTKKHPEGRKLYDKYAGKGAGGVQQIQIQAVPIPIQAIPLQIQAVPVREAAPANGGEAEVRKQALEGIGEARSQLRMALEALKQIPGSDDSEPLKKVLERVEAAARKLAETEEKIDR